MKIQILAAAAVAALLAISAPAYAASDQSYESIIDVGLGAQSAPLTLLDNQTLGAGHIDVATAVMDVDIDLIDRDGATAYTEFIYSDPAIARTGDVIYIQRDDLQSFGGAADQYILAGNDLGLINANGADDFTEQISATDDNYGMNGAYVRSS